jgi:hypothetical protein
MGRVFEASDIQDERHILSGMVATDWGEMPSSSLLQGTRHASVTYTQIYAMEDDELNNPI